MTSELVVGYTSGMTTEQLEALEAEIDAIDTAEGVWTEEALARRAVIAEILDKAGRW